MSVVILVPVLLVLWLDAQPEYVVAGQPGGWMMGLGAVVCILAARDWLTMMQGRDEAPNGALVYLTGLSVYAAGIVPSRLANGAPRPSFDWTLGALVLALATGFVTEICWYPSRTRPTLRIAVGLLGGLFVAVPLTALLHLRCQFADAWGVMAVVSVVAVVKCSDTGAYFVGRALGRRKLAPHLSPGKTVAGAWGGILAGCLASVLYFAVVVPWVMQAASRGHWWQWAGYGAVLAVFGIAGDLAESLVKREFGCKDSGKWLPGLGGVLDILDSLTFAAPVAWLWWTVWPFAVA